jgi:hypothetical protein
MPTSINACLIFVSPYPGKTASVARDSQAAANAGRRVQVEHHHGVWPHADVDRRAGAGVHAHDEDRERITRRIFDAGCDGCARGEITDVRCCVADAAEETAFVTATGGDPGRFQRLAGRAGIEGDVRWESVALRGVGDQNRYLAELLDLIDRRASPVSQHAGEYRREDNHQQRENHNASAIERGSIRRAPFREGHGDRLRERGCRFGRFIGLDLLERDPLRAADPSTRRRRWVSSPAERE